MFKATPNPKLFTIEGKLPFTVYKGVVAVLSNYIYFINTYTDKQELNKCIYRSCITKSGNIEEPKEYSLLPDATITEPTIYVSSNRKYVYLISGFKNNDIQDVIYRATLDEEENLSEFTLVGNLPCKTALTEIVETTTHVYLVGGVINSPYDYEKGEVINSDIVLYTTKNEDQSLNEFVIDEVYLPIGISNTTVIATSKKVYLIGGIVNDTETDFIYSFDVENGKLINFKKEKKEFPSIIYSASVISLKNHSYIFGGVDEGGELNTIYRIEFNKGLLKDITLVGTLPDEVIALVSFSLISDLDKEYIYLLGGFYDHLNSNKNIYRARLENL